ncbi:MAG: hypothetical protein ACRCYU_08180 [Nocardioides sp.]
MTSTDRTHIGRDPAHAELAAQSCDVYDLLRVITHTTAANTLPGPVAFIVLGHLKGLGWLLPQTLQQLGDGLARSLSYYEVYEQDGTEPGERVAQARAFLADAAAHAADFGYLMDQAQQAISNQRHRDRRRCLPNSPDHRAVGGAIDSADEWSRS